MHEASAHLCLCLHLHLYLYLYVVGSYAHCDASRCSASSTSRARQRTYPPWHRSGCSAVGGVVRSPQSSWRRPPPFAVAGSIHASMYSMWYKRSAGRRETIAKCTMYDGRQTTDDACLPFTNRLEREKGEEARQHQIITNTSPTPPPPTSQAALGKVQRFPAGRAASLPPAAPSPQSRRRQADAVAQPPAAAAVEKLRLSVHASDPTLSWV